MHHQNTTHGVPAQVRILQALAWIQWASTALFVAFDVESRELAEYAIFDALVDANDDPLKQEFIVYNVANRVRRKGYRKPCPRLPSGARERKRFVDAVCEQLAQRQPWGRVTF
jgi:hypothetical protein